MKKTETYTRCENCNILIMLTSPPRPEQYEQGILRIKDGSVLLLSNEVAEARRQLGVSNPRAEDIGGYYCDINCLAEYIKEMLKSPL